MIIDLRNHYKKIQQEASQYSLELEDKMKKAMSYMYGDIAFKQIVPAKK